MQNENTSSAEVNGAPEVRRFEAASAPRDEATYRERVRAAVAQVRAENREVLSRLATK